MPTGCIGHFTQHVQAFDANSDKPEAVDLRCTMLTAAGRTRASWCMR